MVNLLPYEGSNKVLWNDFNSAARNGHFLFDRNYMEYHSDRFADASCIVFYDGAPIALFPANAVGDTLFSHQGLTFGGLVLGDRANSLRVLDIFDRLLQYGLDRGFKRIVYKPVPFIYHRRPAQEDLYALFRCSARVIRCDVTTSIDYTNPGLYSKRRERGIRKASSAGIQFAQSHNWRRFWDLLTETLTGRHGVKPVHTADEIELLAARFPDAIRLYVSTLDNEVVAGVVMYDTATVAHAQYIAANEKGRQQGALDGLFDFLITHYSATRRFFDFGISNEDHGRSLNVGLVSQKEEFGGSTVVHEVYEIDLVNCSRG